MLPQTGDAFLTKAQVWGLLCFVYFAYVPFTFTAADNIWGRFVPVTLSSGPSLTSFSSFSLPWNDCYKNSLRNPADVITHWYWRLLLNMLTSIASPSRYNHLICPLLLQKHIYINTYPRFVCQLEIQSRCSSTGVINSTWPIEFEIWSVWWYKIYTGFN